MIFFMCFKSTNFFFVDYFKSMKQLEHEHRSMFFVYYYCIEWMSKKKNLRKFSLKKNKQNKNPIKIWKILRIN